jgi:hypothetical protein
MHSASPVLPKYICSVFLSTFCRNSLKTCCCCCCCMLWFSSVVFRCYAVLVLTCCCCFCCFDVVLLFCCFPVVSTFGCFAVLLLQCCCCCFVFVLVLLLMFFAAIFCCCLKSRPIKDFGARMNEGGSDCYPYKTWFMRKSQFLIKHRRSEAKLKFSFCPSSIACNKLHVPTNLSPDARLICNWTSLGTVTGKNLHLLLEYNILSIRI